MSLVLQKLKSELEEFVAADVSSGGLSGLIDVQSVQVGDPGFLMSEEYPYVMVQSGTIAPKSETIGRSTGYNVFTFNYTLSIMIDATDYFDPTESGNDGEEPLEDAGLAMLLWFYRVANRQLDGVVPGIRNVYVSSVDFLPDERGLVYARRALLVLTVEMQFQHKP